ncbi:12968_t:CDS:1, partial [Racocetra fulgida]
MGSPHPIWNYFDKLGMLLDFNNLELNVPHIIMNLMKLQNLQLNILKKCQLVSNNKQNEYLELEKVYKDASKKLNTNLKSTLSTIVS